MTRQRKMATLIAGMAIAAIATPMASARAATQLGQAELAGLSPQLREQVLARAVNGNSVTEVLQVMLLNNIKIRHEASLIVALDWARGVAVVQLPSGGMAAIHFDCMMACNRNASI
jgi:hypothetical protein